MTPAEKLLALKAVCPKASVTVVEGGQWQWVRWNGFMWAEYVIQRRSNLR